MNETLSLDTSLRQQQRLTPLQVQFVKMLEMTPPELEETVRRAVDEMPALEATYNDEPTDDAENNDSQQSATNSDPTPLYNRRARNYSADDTYYDAAAAAPERSETLLESLDSQLALTDMTDLERIIAANIIGNLDDNGYIARTLDEIADDVSMHTSIPVDTATVNNVWQKVRSLEPAGIGAVDLRDCLLLQLRRMPGSPDVDNAIEIVNHYFDIFAKMHFDRLKSATGLTDEQMRDAIAVIRRLNPKPGSAFASGGADDDAPRHVTPDFAVDIDGDNLVLTRLSHIPELSIERTFARDTPISSASRRDDVNVFIRNKRSEAQSFIKVLNMRQETLYRVMQAILKLQHDFFLTGDESLIRPMILKDIKELTGYGISIISRATSGKYVATPHGTYALKSLFNERPKDDNDTSSHQIFAAMRRLIENEDPRHPLSDERITQQLNSMDGIDIARRTVAKYRERLGYPVARLRRKL